MASPDERLARQLLEQYAEQYAAQTTREPGLIQAGEWWRLSLRYPEVTPAVAAGWDRAGWSASAAEPLIREGITPERARQAGKLLSE